MANWTPTEWGLFFLALGTFFNTVLVSLGAFFAALAKIKGDTNAKAIQENTALTKDGTAAAAKSAKAAADAATIAAEKTDELASNLNGKLDEKIAAAISLHSGGYDARINLLESEMKEMRTSVDGLGKNVDLTRHEFRSLLQTMTSKLDLALLTSRPPAKAV